MVSGTNQLTTLPAVQAGDTQLIAKSSPGMPTPQELAVYQAWSQNAFESQMYRTVGKPAAIMMIMLAAREYGIGPAQALNGGIRIIEGNVELSSRMMSALIRRGKHSLTTIEHTEKICRLKGRRRDNGDEGQAEFTIEEAAQAGLIKEKSGWKKYPKDMLYSRALSRLARQLFSDVIGIGYIQGEIREVDCEVIEEKILTSDNSTIDLTLKMWDDVHEALDGPLRQKAQSIKEYVAHLSKTFSWTETETLQRMLKDTGITKERFEWWLKSVIEKQEN